MAEGFKTESGTHFLEGREAIGCHRNEQTAAGLRVAEQGFLALGQGTDFLAVTLEIAIGTSGSAIFVNVEVDILPRWGESRRILFS